MRIHIVNREEDKEQRRRRRCHDLDAAILAALEHCLKLERVRWSPLTTPPSSPLVCIVYQLTLNCALIVLSHC